MKFGALLISSTAIFLAFSGQIGPASASSVQPFNINSQMCFAAAQREERARTIPDALLQAISLAESGRRDEATRRLVAWPWTVMAEGKGRYFPSKKHAVAAVKELQQRGVQNIDVGCMQINLMHHGDAFDTIETALDPETNVAYGARYLSALRRETDSWFIAVKRYHSANPKFHMPYRGRVFRIWRNIKKRQLAVQASRPTAEVELAENSESMSIDIRHNTAAHSVKFPPPILETRQHWWRDAFKQANAALSKFDSRTSKR